MPLPKAFLSHSSKDKPFVEAVAQILKREFCLYDAYCFHAGDDLTESIDKAVATSALIILFASPASLASDWVGIELRKGQERNLAEATYRGIALGISEEIKHTDLPEWLQAARFEVVQNPEQAARIIRTQLEAVGRKSGRDPFVGRRTETERFEELLATAPSARARGLVFYGLESIGRRTLCARLAKDLLSLERTIEIPVPKGETIQDLATTLAAHVEPYRTAEDFRRRSRDIKRLPNDAAARIASSSLGALLQEGSLPVFVDKGGLLDENAILSPPVNAILEELANDANAYCATISYRRPEITSERLPHAIFTYVEPLSAEEMQRLIVLLLQRDQIEASRAEVHALTEHCKGHPASATYAAKLCARYGASVLVREIHPLVEFRANFFVGYLRANVLSEDSAQVLRLLAFYRTLPFSVIARSLSLSANRLATIIVELSDLSLVHTSGRLYSLAHPVEDAVLRVFGIAGVDHAAAAQALSDFLEEAAPDERDVALSRALFRAYRYLGTPPTGWALATVAELLQAAKDLYHEREYDRAIALLREVLTDDADLWEARDFLVRALIQSDRFDEAAEETRPFQEKGRLRDFFFLQGFNLRKQDNAADARKAYIEAERRGRRDLKLYRELAMCAVHLNDDEAAMGWIKKANAIDHGNRYLVDLGIQIAVRRGDAKEAHAGLKRLELVDRPEFYWYRRSTVEYMEGKVRDALSSALKAGLAARPSFAMVSQIAKCQIELDHFEDAAAAIRRLESTFPRHGHDIKLGLWCKWELAQSNFQNAAGYWSKIRDKSLAVHRALRLDIVRGLLQNEAAPGAVALKQELEELQGSIAVDAARYADVEQRDNRL